MVYPLAPVKRLLLVLAALIMQALAYSTISNQTLRAIPGPGDDFDIKDGVLLAPILIPRVPGTPGSTKVLNHFVDFFKTSLPDWKLELQNSTSTTPTSKGKQIPFVNLIATRDPPGSKVGEVGRLALVAHYDSKSEPEGFIGAIDSAAPCAMLMHAARSIDKALTQKWEARAGSDDMDSLEMATDKGIQILLLDGEEAFFSWSDTDSIYGARALAEAWEDMPHPGPSTYHNNISSIDIFVLLDLLGAKDAQIPSYFLPTHWAYKAMANLELRLRELGEFKSSTTGSAKDPSIQQKDLFLPSSDLEAASFGPTGMGDDHLPFLARGVEVLHLIPRHFPDVWHRIEDDGEHLDMNTVGDWAKLITAFAAEWMELEGFPLVIDERRKHQKRSAHDEL